MKFCDFYLAPSLIFPIHVTRNKRKTHCGLRRKECSVFYSTFALVLVPVLVSLLSTHAQHMLSSVLLSFLLHSPSLILQVQSQFPASCLSVCVCVCQEQTKYLLYCTSVTKLPLMSLPGILATPPQQSYFCFSLAYGILRWVCFTCCTE